MVKRMRKGCQEENVKFFANPAARRDTGKEPARISHAVHSIRAKSPRLAVKCVTDPGLRGGGDSRPTSEDPAYSKRKVSAASSKVPRYRSSVSGRAEQVIT